MAKKNKMKWWQKKFYFAHRFLFVFLAIGLIAKIYIITSLLSHTHLSAHSASSRVLSSQDESTHTFTGFGLRGYFELIGDIGVINTLKIMTKPIGEQQFAIHEYADFGCTAPNAWYVNDDQYMQVCLDAKARGENFVCGEDCPDERWTGAACGAGHRCCRPKVDGEQPPSKTFPTQVPEKKSDLKGCVEGEGGLQYCSFNVTR